mgnify:CR=1 FL=1
MLVTSNGVPRLIYLRYRAYSLLDLFAVLKDVDKFCHYT